MDLRWSIEIEESIHSMISEWKNEESMERRFSPILSIQLQMIIVLLWNWEKCQYLQRTDRSISAASMNNTSSIEIESSVKKILANENLSFSFLVLVLETIHLFFFRFLLLSSFVCSSLFHTLSAWSMVTMINKTNIISHLNDRSHLSFVSSLIELREKSNDHCLSFRNRSKEKNKNNVDDLFAFVLWMVDPHWAFIDRNNLSLLRIWFLFNWRLMISWSMILKIAIRLTNHLNWSKNASIKHISRFFHSNVIEEKRPKHSLFSVKNLYRRLAKIENEDRCLLRIADQTDRWFLIHEDFVKWNDGFLLIFDRICLGHKTFRSITDQWTGSDHVGDQ